MSIQRVVLLGSTGSIGTQTLDVIDQLRSGDGHHEVIALSAGHDSPRFRAQIDAIHPQWICVASEDDALRLAADLPDINVVWGRSGLIQLARLDVADLVINAVVGSVGLEPTLAALDEGKAVASANKESLAIGGELIALALQASSGSLISIDSEHHALYRCLGDRPTHEVRRLFLTASGGPFLHASAEDLDAVTPERALRHPTWSMGHRITIDCATMVNKAFEVIGAHRLFGIDYDAISVLIHPDSYVHSLVEFVDGSLLAELGPRDMRIAIQGILTLPRHAPTQLSRLPIEKGLKLSFEPFSSQQFPAYATVLEAAHAGGTALAAINAADETLIKRFLNHEIAFRDIANGLARTLERWHVEFGANRLPMSLNAINHVDSWARSFASRLF